MSVPAHAAIAWDAAVAFWDEKPLLNFPLHDSSGTAIAFIDLRSRQVYADFEKLKDASLLHALPALFAHEIGHHLRYPHTLRLSADLDLLGQDMVPHFSPVYLNLFYDILINEKVGRDPAMRSQLIDLYRILTPLNTGPLFRRYLAIYEALWDCPGAIVAVQSKGDTLADERDRADAFVQVFFGLSTIHEQFVYFCSVFFDLFLDEATAREWESHALSDVDAPDAGDYPADMNPSNAARDALKKGRSRGWVPGDSRESDESGTNRGPGQEQPSTDAAGQAMRRLSRLKPVPGRNHQEFVQTLAQRIYRRAVDRMIEQLPVPKLIVPGDTILPSTLEEVEPGDDPGRVDWIQTVIAKGQLAALSPLAREFIPDSDESRAIDVPRIEIYLDTSGSMPHPLSGLNCMTLAAQTLSAFAIRKGAAVRGIVYSVEYIESEWLRSEDAARSFLFNYSGGGTLFPFDRFRESCELDRDPIRVVISDADFLYNLTYDRLPEQRLEFLLAADRSQRTVLLLQGVGERELKKCFLDNWSDRLHLETVSSADDFGRISAQLARALLGERE